MGIELVTAIASDDLRLDGALHEASPREGPPDGKSSVDAVICFPGVASNFYASTMLEDLLVPLLSTGAAVLWANTRGHDLLYTARTIRGMQRFGAATEIVDQCRWDVAAWCDFLVERGYRRIGIFGHSLGAIKAVYSQAFQPHPAVVRITAASPPRLSYSAFNQGDQAQLFAETIREAEGHVAAGEPDRLMEVRFPFPLVISASSYLDKYGPRERYNVLEFAGRVAIPMQLVYGGLELEHGGAAFAGLPAALAALETDGPPFSLVTIPDADHMYQHQRPDLAAAVRQWFLDGAGEVG